MSKSVTLSGLCGRTPNEKRLKITEEDALQSIPSHKLIVQRRLQRMVAAGDQDGGPVAQCFH